MRQPGLASRMRPCGGTRMTHHATRDQGKSDEMCGRFTQAYTWHELVTLYRLTQAAVNLQPHYNIAPTDRVDVVSMRDGKAELAPMRWGLVPWWWKKPMKELPATFNARAETVASKPMFRDAFKRSRCVIPRSRWQQRIRQRWPSSQGSVGDTGANDGWRRSAQPLLGY